MKQDILLGTYTKASSQGIYHISLDSKNQTFGPVTLVQKETSPTYLALSTKNILYTIGSENSEGSLSSYTFNPSDLKTTFLNAVSKSGAAPCYVRVDEKRQLVYSANYHQGSLRSYIIAKDGALILADEVCHQGSGPHENQEKAHVHYSDLTPNGFVVTCDLGTDEVTTYEVNESGQLTEKAVFHCQPGTGPRHLVFHPNGKFAYIIGELANTLTVVNYFDDGHFETCDTYTTIPEAFTEFSAGGAVRISKDGKFVYVSNRGHNSLAVFAVKKEGSSLELVEIISSHGDFPRDFNLDATGDFLVCAHQKSGHLSLFKVDQTSGKLTFISNDTMVPEAVCVCFY